MTSLLDQYVDSKNFMARVELNRRFGTNPHKWTLWIFDQIQFPKSFNSNKQLIGIFK